MTVAVLWGFPYLFMRVAVGEVSPVFVAWSRLAVAAAILVPLAASRGALRPALGRWRWIALLGAYYMALAWTLIPFAERTLASSLTAIVIAGVPMMVTVLELGHERPTPSRLAGLALGFGGVAALVGLEVGFKPSQLLALACLLVVLVCYAAGPVMTRRRLAGVDPVATAGLAAASAAILLTPAVLFQLPARVPSPPVLLSLAALGLLCSAVALAVWFFLIGEAGPGRASIVTYVNPAVAVAAGAVLLHERIGPGAVAGMALILGGSYIATAARPRVSAAEAAPA